MAKIKAKKKQDRTHHTPTRQFRIPQETLDALDRIAARYNVNRTAALKLAIHAYEDAMPTTKGGRKPKEV